MLIRFKVVSNWKISRRVVGTERNKEVVRSQLAASSWQQRRKNADRCKKKNRTKFPQSETHRRLVLHSGGIFQSSCVGEPVSSKKRTTTPHFSCCTTRYGSGSRPKFECFVQAGCTINFLFLSSSLMAHFNSKLNTLAALISPPSFRNFFVKSAANSGRL